MRYLLPLIVTVLLFNCCNNKNINKSIGFQRNTASSKYVEEKEKTYTLSFHNYGIYINNWPDSYSLANHGMPFNEGKVETFFMIFTPSGSIGTISIKGNPQIKDKISGNYPSLKLIERNEFSGNVDLKFHTIGKNEITITLNALPLQYEKFFIHNLTTITPTDSVTIKEIKLDRFPLVVPNGLQSVVFMLNFNAKKKGNDIKSSFSLWVRNNYSGLGGVCEIDSLIKGELDISFTEHSKQMILGDSIIIFNRDKSRQWVFAYKNDYLVLNDISSKQKKTKVKIPVSKDYKWEFYCQKYENKIILELGK